MVDKCESYAQLWRFSFSKKKSKKRYDIKFYVKFFHKKPTWNLGDIIMNNENSMEILGITFNNKGTVCNDIEGWKRKYRRAAHSLTGVGMSHLGPHAEVKTHLWKSICQQTLAYGLENMNLSKGDALKQPRIHCQGIHGSRKEAPLLKAVTGKSYEHVS